MFEWLNSASASRIFQFFQNNFSFFKITKFALNLNGILFSK